MSTPGKDFYNRQIQLLEAYNIKDLVEQQYAEDAELVGFDFTVKGRAALLKHFEGYLANLGSIKLVSTEKFTETEDSIFFEAKILVKFGIAHVYDVFILRNGKATHHFTGLISVTPETQG